MEKGNPVSFVVFFVLYLLLFLLLGDVEGAGASPSCIQMKAGCISEQIVGSVPASSTPAVSEIVLALSPATSTPIVHTQGFNPEPTDRTATTLFYPFNIITLSALNTCFQIFWKSQGPSDRPKMNGPSTSSIAC